MSLKNLAPIVLTTWKRPWHTEQTLIALEKNKYASESILYIYSDSWRDEEMKESVLATRKVCHRDWKFKKVVVIENEKWGSLGHNVINAVSKTLEKHDRVIVMEDDLVTSPTFLEFMNLSLDKYENEQKVASIAGHNHPIATMKIPKSYEYDTYFSIRPFSTGWATWKDRWEKVDWDMKDYEGFSQSKEKIKEFNRGGSELSEMLRNQMDGKINSWAIRWTYHHYKYELLALVPTISFIYNTGYDEHGTHARKKSKADKFNERRYTSKVVNMKEHLTYPSVIETDPEMIKRFRGPYHRGPIYYAEKLLSRILP